MIKLAKFEKELASLHAALKNARCVLITSPGAADGDSLGAQLALRRMIAHRYPEIDVRVVNDEPMPARYRFLPDVDCVTTPEAYLEKGWPKFQVGILVDGGIDRAGRVKEPYDACPVRVFIDHHSVSIEYPYTLPLVEPTASATTELIYYISQTPEFATPLDKDFAQFIYLGLIFDTGFFRHYNTTPESMELGARLLRTGFNFTQVGERGMLERSFSSLQLMSYTISHAKLNAGGKIIWSCLTQEMIRTFQAVDDDREGIIDHLFLTRGIEVACLFFELPGEQTKISLRSQGVVDVAKFARSITEHGGGHQRAAGALLDLPVSRAIELVLSRLEKEV